MKNLFILSALLLASFAGISAQECDDPINTNVPCDLSQKHGHVIGMGTYMYGATACIEAVPDEGYVFAGWSDGSTENPRVFKVEYSIESRFEKAPAKTREEINEMVLKIYTNHLTLYVSSQDEEDFEVYTTAGVRIYSGHETRVELPMSGIYIVKSKEGITKVCATDL